ncbi:MAG: haloalkane dehalogenase [Gammaproteobacteria bacterium]
MSFAMPQDFNYPSKFADVLGSRMHYVEHGAGDPILFLHGQPTWSYLWRNVMAELEGRGRLIALDLIGYGRSDKPDIDYEMADHQRYVEAFIEELGLENITLVIHDWGSFFGFNYACRNPDKVKGIAFMEAILFPVPGFESFDPQMREFFQTLRASQANAEQMMVEQNLFIEGILPAAINRELSPAEHDAYRAPWTNPADRRILCKFPQNLCIGGEPKAINDIQMAYMTWLEECPHPKLLCHAEPGILIPREAVAWCKEHLPNLTEVGVGPGTHYIQEDNPQAIGRAIDEWMVANQL